MTPEPLDLGPIRNAKESVSSPDSLAINEDRSLARESERAEKTRALIHGGVQNFLRVAICLVLVALVIRAWHVLAPHSWCWLDAEQIQTIDKTLFSGTLGAIIGRYFKISSKPVDSGDE
jgi:hypothetical protein